MTDKSHAAYKTIEIRWEGGVLYPEGFRFAEWHETLSEAIRWIDGAKRAELIRLDNFVEGVDLQETIALIVDGEWLFIDEEIDMAKVVKAKKNAARDIAADLIGGPAKKKAAAKKAAAKKAGGGSRSRASYEDSAKIKVLKKPEVREGTNRAKIWDLIAKSGTFGNWQKLRAKAGFGTGFFSKMVRGKFIKVG